MRAEVRLRLYGRAYCHLCEEMAEQLRGLGVAFDEIDVDADPALESRLGERVPVLAGPDGTEICQVRLDVAALQKALLK